MSGRERRRLLAVMFTDVVGYTALMEGDEETARAVRRRHREAVDVAVASYQGELFQYLGDGSVTMFPSVYDAVQAALAVQHAVTQEPAVPLRIGIHLGDISYDTQGAYGSSMNVASRIQSLGTPGSILISAKAEGEIRGRTEIRTTRLGRFELKNVDEPLELYAVVSDAVAVPSPEDVRQAVRKISLAASDVLHRLNVAMAGRYVLERELGQGGMASVYEAEDARHGRRVAVKVLHPEVAAAVGPGRFLREIEIAARLTHPHILPIHDSGAAGGLLYFVMPYVDGESLQVRLERERQLPVEEAVRIAREVAEALGYAHGQGVIHRDVKPANILMEAGRAVLADFGIAKLAADADEEPLTKTGVSVGTPAYMSPEQASGDQEVDERSDVYSLGCVLYEMLVGEPPYTGRSAQAVLSRKLSEPVAGLRTVRETVPEALEQITRKALARLPADRFRTMRDFAAALGNLDGFRARRRLRLPRVPKAATALVGTAAVVAALTVGYFRLAPEQVPDHLPRDVVAVFPFENLAGDPELDDLGQYAAFGVLGGLGWMSEASVLEWNTVLRALRDGGETATRRELSATLGAGTMVTGAYIPVGDRIEFQAQVTDVASAEVLHSVETIASADAPTEGVDELTQRVMGAIAMALDDPERVRYVTRPPTYEAYRAFQQADELYTTGDPGQALEKFDEAFRLDTSFVDALQQSMIMYYALQRWPQMDSTLALVEPRVAELRPVNRAWARYYRGILAGDKDAMVEAIQAVHAIDPAELPEWVAEAMIHAGRAEGVLRFWEGLDEDARSTLQIGGWNSVGKALHVLGRYEDQLEIGRAITERFPNSVIGLLHESLALVGLGRLEEMQAVLVGVEDLRIRFLWTPGGVLALVSADLARRGYDAESREMLERALTWYRFADPRSSEAPPDMLLAAGYEEEAVELLRRRLEEDPESIETRGLLGLALAKVGDRSGSEAQARWLEELDEPYVRGRNTYWRAAIAAHLGQEASAVQLLRTALLEGQGYSWLHVARRFAPLWGNEAFAEVIRPRD